VPPGRAYLFDNALVVLAYLANPSHDHGRTRALVEGILAVQEPYGRLYDAYDVSNANPTGTPPRLGLHTGNMARAGIALASYAWANMTNPMTGTAAQALTGVRLLGMWVSNPYVAFDSTGHGGYRGGIGSNNNLICWKATEPNIDAFAFLTMLAKLDAYLGVSSFPNWTGLANWAWS